MAHNPGFLNLVNDAKSRAPEMDIDGYKKMVAGNEPHVLVDVREDNEFAAGHVKGAVHLSKGIIERDIEIACVDPRYHLAGPDAVVVANQDFTEVA